MNNERMNRDQANDLRDQIENDLDETMEMNPSSLPSRSEVHQHKQKKTKWKLKHPVIKLLAFFFILLPVVIYSIFTYLDGLKDERAEQAAGEKSGFDTVDIDTEENGKTSMEIRDEEQTDQESVGATSDDEEQPPSDEEKSVVEEEMEDKQPSEGQSVEENKVSENLLDEKQTGGQKPSEKPTEPKQPTQPSQPNPDLIYHTVQPNETLFRISMKYYQSQVGIDKIKNANGLRTDDIRAGQVLKIPLNK